MRLLCFVVARFVRLPLSSGHGHHDPHLMTELDAAIARIDTEYGAALDDAFTAYYPELRQIAHARLMRSSLRGQLETTALVHDSYLKLASGAEHKFVSRLHFLAYASRTVRSVVVDIVREQRAQRRGGEFELVTLDTAAQDGVAGDIDVEAVNGALDDLAKLDAGLARLVEMRFFGGLSAVEIAEALGMSERTVQREWAKARALLLTLIS